MSGRYRSDISSDPSSRGDPSRISRGDPSHTVYPSANSSQSASTIDAVYAVCDGCDSRSHTSHNSYTPRTPHTSHSSRNDHCRPSRGYDPGVSYFISIVTPVTGLTPQFGGVTGAVEFKMRRKNKTVTLQWQPFSGALAASGIAFLTVAQSICNTPRYPVSFPIYISYRGVGRITNVTIDPFATTGNIKFYLNTDGSTANTNIGDSFVIHGSAVTWIVD